MRELQEYLLHQVRELAKIEEKVEDVLKDAPEGYLYITKNKNTNQFYWRVSSGNKKDKYIKKSNEKLIKELACKEYARKLLPVVRKQRSCIERFVDEYSPKEIENIYVRLHDAKKQFVSPYIMPDGEYIKQWKIIKNKEKLEFNNDKKIIDEESGMLTDKGEVVRSKSEKILADKLYKLNIPYIYEAPLYLKGYGYIMPDFTVLNIRERKEYYWEHLGMMGDENYCEKAIKKIETYQKNGIFPGNKLILTYETITHPLNVRCVENLIHEYLI